MLQDKLQNHQTISVASRGEVTTDPEKWQEWDRRSLLRYVERAIRSGWDVKPDVMNKMAGIAEKIAENSPYERNQLLAVKVLAALDRAGVERARLALDALKLSTLDALSAGSNRNDGPHIDVEITHLKARLSDLRDPSLGRSLVPGLPEFIVDVKPESTGD